LHPENLAIAIVSNLSETKKEMEEIGEVEVAEKIDE